MPGLFGQASSSEWREAENKAIEAAETAALSEIQGANSREDLHVRDVLPDEDLEAGADQTTNGWNGTDRVWLQGDMSSADLMNSYTIDPLNGADGKVIVFYAIGAEDADPTTTEVEFRDDTGGVFERVSFQEAHNGTERVRALMRNPIVYHEGHGGEVYQYSDDDSTTVAAGTIGDLVTDNVILYGVVAEKAGTTLGIRSETESAPSGVARGNF